MDVCRFGVVCQVVLHVFVRFFLGLFDVSFFFGGGGIELLDVFGAFEHLVFHCGFLCSGIWCNV